MKFVLTKTSSYNFCEIIEVNTLEELIKLIRDNGEKVVICLHENDILSHIYQFPEIEIYDDWRE